MKLKIIKQKKKKTNCWRKRTERSKVEKNKKNLPTKVKNNYYYLTLSLIYKKKKQKTYR